MSLSNWKVIDYCHLMLVYDFQNNIQKIHLYKQLSNVYFQSYIASD
jgi:hypothetical protein